MDSVLSDEWLCLRKVYCPTDLGLPIRRKRIYICWIRRNVLKMSNAIQLNLEELFQSVFYRKVVATGAIYLIAAPEQVHR